MDMNENMDANQMKAVYNITSNADGGATISLYENGRMYVADNTHGNWDAIVANVTAGDRAGHLFDATITAAEKFKKVSNRVSVSGGQLYFDNELVNNRLAKQIIAFLREDLDFIPLVNFYEKIATNPTKHSRKQLYKWLDKNKFTIDSDGDIIMYKGVTVDPDGETYRSIHAGPAIVDGVSVNGHVPQKVGTVVEMPRSAVNADPSVGCSYGLHASSWDYAKNFSAGAVLTLKVNPADVVSVPTDCDEVKVRTFRYKVVGVTEVEIPQALYDYEEDDYDGDYDEDMRECDACGYEYYAEDVVVGEEDEDLCPECGAEI